MDQAGTEPRDPLGRDLDSMPPPTLTASSLRTSPLRAAIGILLALIGLAVSAYVIRTSYPYELAKAAGEVALALILVVAGGAVARPDSARHLLKTVHVPRWIRALAKSKIARRSVALLGVFVACAALNWWQANREMNNLLQVVEASQKSLNSTMDTAPQQESYGDTDQWRSAWSSWAIRLATEGKTSGAEIGDVYVLPWHFAIKDARRAVVKQDDSLSRYVSSIADGTKSTAEQIAVDADSNTARRRLKAAVPPFPLFDLRWRAETALS